MLCMDCKLSIALDALHTTSHAARYTFCMHCTLHALHALHWIRCTLHTASHDSGVGPAHGAFRVASSDVTRPYGDFRVAPKAAHIAGNRCATPPAHEQAITKARARALALALALAPALGLALVLTPALTLTLA